MIFDVEMFGHYTIQVEAKDATEASKLGLVAYRKNSGSVENLDNLTVNQVVTGVKISDKKGLQYV